MWNFIAGLNVSKPLDNNIIWYCYHLCDEIKCLYLVAVTILTILKVHFFGVGVLKNFAPSSFFACYGTASTMWHLVTRVRIRLPPSLWLIIVVHFQTFSGFITTGSYCKIEIIMRSEGFRAKVMSQTPSRNYEIYLFSNWKKSTRV